MFCKVFEVLSKPCGWIMEQKKVSDDHSSSTEVRVRGWGGMGWCVNINVAHLVRCNKKKGNCRRGRYLKKEKLDEGIVVFFYRGRATHAANEWWETD